MHLYNYHPWCTCTFTPLNVSGGNGENQVSLKKAQLWPKWHAGEVVRMHTHVERTGTHMWSLQRSQGAVGGIPGFPGAGGWLVICSWRLWLERAIHVWLLATLLVDQALSTLLFFMKTLEVFFSDHLHLCTAQRNEQPPACTSAQLVYPRGQSSRRLKWKIPSVVWKQRKKLSSFCPFTPQSESMKGAAY